ncbi:MAG: pyruvate dehydrogenase complex E1 component subunit beta [Solitalea-like symbiont of Acarus siro]
METRQIQFREALKEAMQEEMLKDDKVFLIGEEVAQYNGAYKVSHELLEKFGADRVIDTPISELGFTGISVGAAINGLKPIVEFMTFNFSLVAIDQIINNAAKILSMSGGQLSCPITFRGPTGHAGQLAAQHSQSFHSWYANCPGLKVIIPSNAYNAKGLLKSAIKDPDPVIFMESELMYGDKYTVPAEEYYLPIGKAHIVTTGNDITIVSFGKMLKTVLNANQELKKLKINEEIIDLLTIRPLDYMTIIESVKKTNRLLIVEEAWPISSISTEISYIIQKEAFDYLDAPIMRLTAADVPLPYAPNLIKAAMPSETDIIDMAKDLIYLQK